VGGQGHHVFTPLLKLIFSTPLLGQLNPSEIVTRLQRSSGRVELVMAQIRADRQERVQSRQIREQQDEAYLASLRADQEKVTSNMEIVNGCIFKGESDDFSVSSFTIITKPSRPFFMWLLLASQPP
jgi:hypothetical protein